ncbi:MAG: DNA polymerase III subunit gamma/tau [Deltaproteobacteria bacterium]|nr:DNA polymerase III subunit gamma/tau [Deltaproteobacteria bacterium]
MSYQIFARKYRPQSFDEVLGQGAVVQTLKNSIKFSRLHQAYLFCGARGIGKTSLARIFAKSVNCEKGPTENPCQTCASCIGITKGNSLNVLEIDGASNTGVEDVRELREQAKYLPQSGKYKIYIIDEVHMLSGSAFNALLKILEEPPAHLIFLFATTEPHKIPVTILSRCQRFDLKRLTNSELMGHLKKILTEEGLSLPDESLSLIIHASEGSVRDALSLLDQIVSFCGKEASPEKVREVLGLSDRVVSFDMLLLILKGDSEAALKKGEEVFNGGFDLKIFSEGLLELIRHVLVTKEGGGDLVELSPGEKEKINSLAGLAVTNHFLNLFQILARGTEELARSEFPRFVFETLLIKMIRAREFLSIPEILEKLSNNSPSLEGRPFAELTAPGAPEALYRGQGEGGRGRVAGAAASSSASPPTTPGWSDFVKQVLETKPQIGALLEHARPLKVAADVISLGFDPKSIYADMLKERASQLEAMAVAFYKRQVKLDIRPLTADEKGVPNHLETRLEEAKKKAEELKTRVLANPAVQKAQEIFGAVLREVKESK